MTDLKFGKGGMFYGAKPGIFKKAEVLRAEMTNSEKLFWSRLNKSQLGVRFKAQHPVDTFIVDFYCHVAKIVVEVDGGYHLTRVARERDQGRTFELESKGLLVIRFTNDEVENDLDSCVKSIQNIVKSRSPL